MPLFHHNQTRVSCTPCPVHFLKEVEVENKVEMLPRKEVPINGILMKNSRSGDLKSTSALGIL
jgi:hypothetical protein